MTDKTAPTVQSNAEAIAKVAADLADAVRGIDARLSAAEALLGLGEVQAADAALQTSLPELVAQVGERISDPTQPDNLTVEQRLYETRTRLGGIALRVNRIDNGGSGLGVPGAGAVTQPRG